MCEDIIRAVAGCSPVSCAAALTGFRRVRVRGEHYPGLIRDPDGRVDGVLYRDIEAAAWARLDSFEGDMYERITVTVESGDGTRVDADTYLVRRESENRLERIEWDFETFLDNGKRAFVREYAGYESVRDRTDRAD